MLIFSNHVQYNVVKTNTNGIKTSNNLYEFKVTTTLTSNLGQVLKYGTSVPRRWFAYRLCTGWPGHAPIPRVLCKFTLAICIMRTRCSWQLHAVH